MIKKLHIFAVLFLFTLMASAQIVNIPDANFKAILVADTSINTNNDAEIQVTEANGYTGSIEVNSSNISSLTGIEAFTQITELQCYNNQLTSLDVTQNTALTKLYCFTNQLTSLDVTQNTALTILECYSNQLTSLDVTQNTVLDKLRCQSNQLTNLDVNQNAVLTYLECKSNPLTSLDVSQNTALTFLDCRSNQIASLDVSQNTALQRLYCNTNQLTSLDVSQNTALQRLYCNTNQLTSLDVTQNTALTILECPNNQLTSLNVKNGNNVNFINFNALNNPDLDCIVVDDANYSTTNWTNIDASCSFANSQTECDNLSTEEFALTNINMYPNPFHSEIVINGLQQSSTTKIYDIYGKLIINTSKQVIDTSQLSSGLYIVTVAIGNSITTKKMIKK